MALGGSSIYPGSAPFPFPYIPPRCDTCGAELADEELHKEWHEELRKQLLDLFLAIPLQK